MPQPTRGMIHIDRALTNMSVAYMQKDEAFIADKVFPIVGVQRQSDVYYRYSRADWFRDEAKKRAPATESAGGIYTLDTATYFCEKWAYHKDVTEEERVNADAPLRPDEDATNFVTSKLLLKREVEWARNFFSITTGAQGDRESAWGGNVVGGTMSGDATAAAANQFVYWSNDNSTPIEDISAAKVQMASLTGHVPNTLVLSPRVYETLRNHDDILGRIVFTQRGVVNTEVLASLFDVERIFVAWSVQNSAIQGAAEATDFIFGDHALLAHSAPSPGLKIPTAGYILAWTGLMGASAFGNRMQRLPMPILGMGTERIEGEMAFDMQVIAADLGIFFADCLAP